MNDPYTRLALSPYAEEMVRKAQLARELTPRLNLEPEPATEKRRPTTPKKKENAMDKKELAKIVEGLVNKVVAAAPEGAVTEGSARALLGMALNVNAQKLVESCKLPGAIG